MDIYIILDINNNIQINPQHFLSFLAALEGIILTRKCYFVPSALYFPPYRDLKEFIVYKDLTRIHSVP